jgi:hypothetical protein
VQSKIEKPGRGDIRIRTPMDRGLDIALAVGSLLVGTAEIVGGAATPPEGIPLMLDGTRRVMASGLNLFIEATARNERERVDMREAVDIGTSPTRQIGTALGAVVSPDFEGARAIGKAYDTFWGLFGGSIDSAKAAGNLLRTDPSKLNELASIIESYEFFKNKFSMIKSAMDTPESYDLLKAPKIRAKNAQGGCVQRQIHRACPC